MELKSIHIVGYKNLIDTRLTLETSHTPICIIGNNGTGKSNLIEALLHIFVGLYYDKPPDFDFHIQYDAHNKAVEISRSQESGGYLVEQPHRQRKLQREYEAYCRAKAQKS